MAGATTLTTSSGHIGAETIVQAFCKLIRRSTESGIGWACQGSDRLSDAWCMGVEQSGMRLAR